MTGDGVQDLAMAAGPGAALDVIIRPGPSLNTTINLTPFAPDYSNGTFVGSAPKPLVLFTNGFA